MEYSRFLADRGCCDELRRKLWDLFQKAEKEAQGFDDSGNCWIRIVEVVECAKSTWDPDGEKSKITIPVSDGNLGVIFHEVFHSAFDQSPLGQAKGNGNDQWGDAFCDAFRYFMDGLHLCDSEDAAFLKPLEDEMDKPNETIRNENNRYTGWGSRIVLKANREYDRFKQLWRERNAKPNEPLTKYFGLA